MQGGGQCWESGGQGEFCKYRHLNFEGEPSPDCYWANTELGCHFGASCRFTHPGRAGPLLDQRRLAAAVVAGQPAYDGAITAQRAKHHAGLRQLLAGKNVMLVGEGDFSFSKSLILASPAQRPALLLCSGLEPEDEVGYIT
jgi:hypothetical protein